MEHHRAVHIPCTLKGPGNYITWSRMTRAALGGRGLWEHVISSSAPKQITQGEDGKEIVVVDEGKWGQEDLMVLSILHSSLDGPLMDTYSHCTTPKQLWDTLQRVYGNTSNLTRIYEVKRAINTLQQEEGDFTKHLGKYSQLWSELEMLRPSSNDPETLEARREQDKIFGLLFTLSPNFNDVVRHILREKELPSYDEVCAQLQKEIGSDGLFGGGKGDLSMAHKVEKVESASANKAHFKPRGGGDKSVTCEHCKYKGHSKTNCWILHPHLRPASANKYNQTRVHEARAQEHPAPSYMRMGNDGRALTSTTHTGGSTSHALSQPSQEETFIRKSDFEALIKALNANSGNQNINALNSIHNASHTARPEHGCPLKIPQGGLMERQTRIYLNSSLEFSQFQKLNSLKSSLEKFKFFFAPTCKMEHHRAVLIPCTLKGPGNYITWSRMTRAALGGRGLWEHVTSSSAPKQITQGEDGKEIVVIDEGKWVQEDLMVLSILHSSLDGPLMDTYSHCTTPKQLWDTLQRVYGNTSNLTRIYEVKRAINTLQQEEGDFTKHLGKYSQLWSELEMLRPSSNDPETIEARREQDKIFGLLFTLSPSFNDVVRHILREKELPSYDEVCAQLQKEIGSDGLFGGGKGDLSMAHKVEKVESASANKAHFKPRGGGDKSVTCQPQQINTARPESMKQELRSIQHPAICAWEMMVEP
ncbi:hypothetical protein Bca4012_058431 [Brassica carinata]